MDADFSGAAAELQAALRARLSGDDALVALVGDRVVDGGPGRAAATPHLAFAGLRAEDWSTDEGEGARIELTLEAVSRQGGRAECLAVLSAASAAIAAAPLALASRTLVLLRSERLEVERLRDGRGWRGRLTLRALVEG